MPAATAGAGCAGAGAGCAGARASPKIPRRSASAGGGGSCCCDGGGGGGACAWRMVCSGLVGGDCGAAAPSRSV